MGDHCRVVVDTTPAIITLDGVFLEFNASYEGRDVATVVVKDPTVVPAKGWQLIDVVAQNVLQPDD